MWCKRAQRVTAPLSKYWSLCSPLACSQRLCFSLKRRHFLIVTANYITQINPFCDYKNIFWSFNTFQLESLYLFTSMQSSCSTPWRRLGEQKNYLHTSNELGERKHLAHKFPWVIPHRAAWEFSFNGLCLMWRYSPGMHASGRDICYCWMRHGWKSLFVLQVLPDRDT